MKRYRPSYYTRFRCLASACPDTCCAGWEICIDPASAASYRQVPGGFGEKLRAGIDWAQPPSFRLEDGRCPFLNRQNLCEIYLHLGKEALCEICTEHPRFHNWYGGLTESGVGLCCQAAAALILDTSTPARFALSEAPEPDNGESPELLGLLFRARETAFSLAQDRSLPITQRFLLLEAYGAEVQDCLDMGDEDGVAACTEDYRSPAYITPLLRELPGEAAPSGLRVPLHRELLDFLLTLEPIDPAWHNRLRGMRENLPALLAAMDADAAGEAAVENLAVYSLFRYLLQSAFDGDFLPRLKLCLLFSHLIRLLNADRDAWIANACACSKELEYSEDNIAALLRFCMDSPTLSHPNLLRLLLPGEA